MEHLRRVQMRVLDRVHDPYRARVRDRGQTHGHDSQRCRVLRGPARGLGLGGVLSHGEGHAQISRRTLKYHGDTCHGAYNT